MRERIIAIQERFKNVTDYSTMYESAGVSGNVFESEEQLKDFFDYDINEVENLDNFNDTDREHIKRGILSLINLGEVDKRHLNLVYKVKKQPDRDVFELIILQKYNYKVSGELTCYADGVSYLYRNGSIIAG